MRAITLKFLGLSNSGFRTGAFLPNELDDGFIHVYGEAGFKLKTGGGGGRDGAYSLLTVLLNDGDSIK